MCWKCCSWIYSGRKAYRKRKRVTWRRRQLNLEIGELSMSSVHDNLSQKMGGGAIEPKAQEETGLSNANVHLCSFFLILRNNVWVLQSILDHKIEHTENAFYIVYFLENDLFANQLWSRPTLPDNRPESPARYNICYVQYIWKNGGITWSLFFFFAVHT